MTSMTTVSLVTGGAGFIGSHLVEALLARGDRVRVLDNLSTGHLENLAGVQDRIDLIEGDIRIETVVQAALAGVEQVFHLAALGSVPESMAKPAETELINAVGTLNILQAAKAAGVRRVILSSTCAIYGDEPTLPKTESSPSCPQSPYAISKLTAEMYCQLFHDSFGLETVRLRYFNVFGPRQDPASAYSGVISIFVDKLGQGIVPTIFGDGQQTRDFVFVEDVVRANVLAAAAPQAPGQVFNIGAGRQVSINQLFQTLADIFECDARPTYGPARPGDILHSYASPALAHSVLGWSAQVTFEEGLRRLVDSVRS
jgi:UDP-glucose 4-epimerase